MSEKQTNLDQNVDNALLGVIADMPDGTAKGAVNIRKNGQSVSRVQSDNVQIVSKTDKPGIDVYFKANTLYEACHVPVIITESGTAETVYNDFYVAENCDVTIIAGCGIHNCGDGESRHDGIHTIHVAKNAKLRYVEKHYGEGDGKGANVMNPQTVVYLEEGAFLKMETAQIKGIDSTRRDTKIYCGPGAEAVVTERLQTHGEQQADSYLEISLDGDGSRGRVISRSVAQEQSRQNFYPRMVGNARCFGHVQCDSILMGDAKISSVPAVVANSTGAELVHEAAIGRIAGDQLLKLQTLGLTKEEAEERILNGFLA